ncbi:twitching motility protein PilT [Halorubrum ezzemoulense]|uniref:twitching motility protein PilT n=1 Tax=Halorubrum ezzemoulense TaxID=337243 RepID=UPI000AABA95C|nr:twitching motility protein PilT [Halorubrum ezzemoulense]
MWDIIALFPLFSAIYCRRLRLFSWERGDTQRRWKLDLLASLPRVVTVAAVERELASGVETHPYLDTALTALDATVPVVAPSLAAARIEAELRETLDPGETQALAVADASDGTIVTDDGDAREIASRREVAVTGSIGVLIRAIESGDLDAETADTHFKRWIDEAGFRSPAREFAAFLDRY